MDDLISVIIPTFRRPEMLRQTIQSVRQQTFPNIEIIVIDDHSGDNTASIVQEFPDVRYFENTCNQGPGLSRRAGLLNSHGNFIVFIDDDDYYIEKDFFKQAIDLFANHPDYVLVAAGAKTLYSTSKKCEESMLNIYGEMSAIEYLSGFVFKYTVPLTFATIFRRTALESCGVFEMEMVNHMPLIMRSLLTGKVFFLNSAVGIYRIHENNISHSIHPDFLINNLKEKLDILKSIKEKHLFEDDAKWWLEQIKVTVSYYVYGSHPSMTDFRRVRKWCEQNSAGNHQIMDLMKQYHAYLIDYRICGLKRRIKKVLGIS